MNEMKYRPYGKTGKMISVLAAGGMRYARPEAVDEMAEIPLEAARMGVNYFDTAPGYCKNMSETILGAAVKQMRREKLEHYISTKAWAPDADQFWKQLESSLKTIGVDAIDFYHAWGVNSWDNYEARKRQGVIEAFRQAKEQGLVRHMVFSSHMSGENIARLCSEGVFEGVLLGFCAINFPFRLSGVRGAAAAGMGVVTMNPLGGGMLIDCEDRFNFIKTRPEQTMVEAALHFNLNHPEITAALVGFRTVEDVRSAVAAVESFQPLPADGIRQIRARIEGSFDALCTTCNYCKECPEEIPVAALMEAHNYYALYGDPSRAFNRLKYHWGIRDLSCLERCTRCRLCESACTQKLPILERFEVLRRLDAEVQAANKEATR
jgi:predicted aldo/keto reductase-like oxidoreductase